MAKKRVFISFDYDDVRYRDFLIGQAKNPNSPMEIEDWSLREPFDEKWKTQCRERIKKVDVVLQLVGKNTHKAKGAVWEVKCAKEEGIPVFGVYIDKNDKGKIPESLSGSRVINWSWDGIANMVKRLCPSKKSRPHLIPSIPLSIPRFHYPSKTRSRGYGSIQVRKHRRRTRYGTTTVKSHKRRRPRRRH